MKISKTILSSLCLLFAVCFTSPLLAQGHEIGVTTSGLTDFNFVYKKQKAENRYIRFGTGAFQTNFNSSTPADRTRISLSFNIGWERRAPIVGKLKFFHGPRPFIGIASQIRTDKLNNENESVLSISPGFSYMLGFMYDISDKFYVGIETTPSISLTGSIIDGEISDDYEVNLGFNSNAVALSFVYKFQKAKKDKK